MKTALCLFLFVCHVYYSHQACYLGADVAMVIDISETATEQDEVYVRSFGQKLLDLASVNEQTLMTLITYRRVAVARFIFDDWYHDEAREQFLVAFQKLRAQGNQTHRGLTLLRDKIFTSCFGARENINKVAILVTDRPSSDISESQERAKLLKSDGVNIFVVVIGDSAADAEVREYSSDPDTVIRVGSFGQLEVAFNLLKNTVFDCSPCADGWIKCPEDDGYCYKLVKNLMSWKTAKDNCVAMHNKSRLIEFDHKTQVDWFLNQYIWRGQLKIWLGYHRDDVSQPFTGVDTAIVNWTPGYPKQHKCVYYTADGLADGGCEEDNVSVCQLRQSDVEMTAIAIAEKTG